MYVHRYEINLCSVSILLESYAYGSWSIDFKKMLPGHRDIQIYFCCHDGVVQ